MSVEKGYLSLVLHAHLPFVRHPEHDYFLEENWLYEAITETYVPLIRMYEGLERDGIPFRLTMSLTPPLISMLQDELLQSRYLKHIDLLIELASKEIDRTKHHQPFQDLAHYYYDLFIKTKETFLKYHCDLIQAFKHFQDAGYLELITCGATHGFLPFSHRTKGSVRGQITTAARHYEKALGRRPQGIWLPECGYYPGVDQFLADEGIRFFLTDTHGVLHGSPRPKYGVFAPVFCESGVAAFGRDTESSKQVWSAEEGYPGDSCYREFYRDIGFDLDLEYIRPYIAPDDLRVGTGMKYYRITGKSDHKEPYVRPWAVETAASHAGNFMFNREKQVEYLFSLMDRKPIVVAPYDAELFGHWWYEGPEFLNFLIRKMACDQKTVRLATPSDYLNENPVNQVSTPALSSWGYKGYGETWLSEPNHYIYKHLHKAALRMQEIANRYHGQGGLTQRAVNQAARELLLAQSSDWAFILHTGTMMEYAHKRTKDHVMNFTKLYDDLNSSNVDEPWLSEIESRNNIFPEIDAGVYCGD